MPGLWRRTDLVYRLSGVVEKLLCRLGNLPMQLMSRG